MFLMNYFVTKINDTTRCPRSRSFVLKLNGVIATVSVYMCNPCAPCNLLCNPCSSSSAPERTVWCYANDVMSGCDTYEVRGTRRVHWLTSLRVMSPLAGGMGNEHLHVGEMYWGKGGSLPLPQIKYTQSYRVPGDVWNSAHSAPLRLRILGLEA